MNIPIVTESVCVAVNSELERKGMPQLIDGLDAIQKTQPALTNIMGVYIDKFIEMHGMLAAESALRLLVLQHKLFETQFEVDELNEQGKL